jgi:hypothetical protein
VIARVQPLGRHALRQREGTGESSIRHLLSEAVPVLLPLLRFALAREGELVVLHDEFDLCRIDPREVYSDAEAVPIDVTGDLRDIRCGRCGSRYSALFLAAQEVAKHLIEVTGGIEDADGERPSRQSFHHFWLLPFAQSC